MRVLVLYESGRGSVAALAVARELVESEEAKLTVVGVAPQAATGARCGNTALDYNGAVIAAVVDDLDHAREWLEPRGVGASYELLIDGSDPALDQFAAAGGFDLVLLPGRRWALRGARHPSASRLRRATGCEVRIVDRRGRRPVRPRTSG